MDFKQAQEMMKLQQQAQKIQEELSNTHIEAEVDGVVVTIDGQLKVVSTVIEDVSIMKDQKKLEKAITDAINKGMKKAQEIAFSNFFWSFMIDTSSITVETTLS